jgi:GNAT superfamily N-acetyltransferase
MNGFVMSRVYEFVRARQLEGTYPGSPQTGVWPISSMRVHYGWGCVPDEAWPFSAATSWQPLSEPDGIDALAKRRRASCYQRVRTVAECKWVLAYRSPILASFEITESWFTASSGRIAYPVEGDRPVGSHVVCILGYDDRKKEFKFINSWGADWGDHGFGYIPYDLFESIWEEGWWMDLSNRHTPSLPNRQDRIYSWGFREHSGGTLHCCELSTPDAERIGWSFAVIRPGSIELEELFVRPQFRGKGHGKRLINELRKAVNTSHWPLKVWVSFADSELDNLRLIRKLTAQFGLSLKISGTRWAAFLASAGGTGLTDEQIQDRSIPGARPQTPLRPAAIDRR